VNRSVARVSDKAVPWLMNAAEGAEVRSQVGVAAFLPPAIAFMAGVVVEGLGAIVWVTDRPLAMRKARLPGCNFMRRASRQHSAQTSV
jgi:hypothetical protein